MVDKTRQSKIITSRSMPVIFLVCMGLVAVSFALHTLNREKPLPGAYIQLPLNSSLRNLGSIPAEGRIEDGILQFADGDGSKALMALGDGSWVQYEVSEKQKLSNQIDVTFEFKPSNWKNPYKKGSASKTIATISGKGERKIQHLSFSITPGSQPGLTVYIEASDGRKKRLHSQRGTISWRWHRVRLSVDQTKSETNLYIDDHWIATEPIVPAVLEKGFDQIKLGTWFKRNQAYRGLIDNFVVRDTSVPLTPVS